MTLENDKSSPEPQPHVFPPSPPVSPTIQSIPTKDSTVPVLRAVRASGTPATYSANENVDSAKHNDPHLEHDPHNHDVIHASHRPERDLFTLMKKVLHKDSEHTQEIESSQGGKVTEESRAPPLDWYLKLKENFKEKKRAKEERRKSQALQAQLDLDNNDPETQNVLRRLSIASFHSQEDETDEAIALEAQSVANLKQYKFVKILGAGAQGTVSLRIYKPTNSKVALKSIPTAKSSVDSHVRDSFFREVEILNTCKGHPHIIQLLNSWESKFTVYQVFDVMTGGDASMPDAFSKITKESQIVRLIAPIADALRFLHLRNIIHRDVRSANVFLRTPITGTESLKDLERIPVLADFGIANYSFNSGRLAEPFFFTPAHIAPEILDQSARFTSVSDCYGLGYYAMQVVIRRAPSLAEVRNSGDVVMGANWDKLSELGKRSVMHLLCTDPFARMTADGFCEGVWVREMDVECVKRKKVIKDGVVVEAL